MTTPTTKACRAYGATEYAPTKALTSGIRLPRRRDVIGEIKPHNSREVNAGVEQLRRSPLRTSREPVLLTYRTVEKTDPSRYQVLMADTVELKAVLAERDREARDGRLGGAKRRPPIFSRLRTWYAIGSPFFEDCALRPIPYHTCPPLLGAQVEAKVRNKYQEAMGALYSRPPFPQLTSKSPWATGHDILHEELADFLAELAVQLQAA
jgi:hypothetical protein